MNVTELARQLKINTNELLELLPGYGFDIGKKAVKIDDRVAQQVIKKWKYIKRDLEEKKRQEFEERKKKEKELRKEMGKTVLLPDKITVKDFATKLEMSITIILTELMKNGILANQNQYIDFETATIMAEELGFTVEKEQQDLANLDADKIEALEEALSKGENFEKRAPVIVVMGHVDHGKTKLLDTIRTANIIDTESGGITQHIGAYQTIWKDPKTSEERALTFIDTPGHEAFTVMRSRGAKIADIAILVVAADDGVKPQTQEVIQIIKAAKLPVVVAINKVDKETADVQKTKTELSQHNLIAEDWGGDTPMVEISAKENLHIDKLLDVLLLVADMNEDSIQADPSIPAVGTVIESHKDKHIGPVATVLIQAGTLRKGESIVIHDEIYGKIRAMRDYNGNEIEVAGPSMPAQIIGFKVAPEVGDILDLGKLDTAQKIDVKQKTTQMTGAQQSLSIEKENNEDEEGKKYLNIIVKSDVLGSLEAIIGSVERIVHPEVGVKIVGKGLGNFNESDIDKAQTFDAKLVGFHVRPTPTAQSTMNEKNLEFHEFEVIYHLMDWIKEELAKLLSSEKIITEHGKMEVKGIFRTQRKEMIVGGVVLEGKFVRNSLLRIVRDGINIGKGKISEIQIGQQKVKSIPSGSEGGIRYEGKEKIEIGDILECYTEENKVKELKLE